MCVVFSVYQQTTLFLAAQEDNWKRRKKNGTHLVENKTCLPHNLKILAVAFTGLIGMLQLACDFPLKPPQRTLIKHLSSDNVTTKRLTTAGEIRSDKKKQQLHATKMHTLDLKNTSLRNPETAVQVCSGWTAVMYVAAECKTMRAHELWRKISSWKHISVSTRDCIDRTF